MPIQGLFRAGPDTEAPSCLAEFESMAYSPVHRFLALYLCLLLPTHAAGAEPPRQPEVVRRDLDVVQRQLLAETVMMEALRAFPQITAAEFARLPLEDLRRHVFVAAWTGHYRRAALGREGGLTSIAEVTEPAARQRLLALDPPTLRQGMGTEGASRTVDPALPAVLRSCAEEHEAVHDRDLHAMARHFARERARELLDSGALLGDPGFVQLERARGTDYALEAFADALFQRDLEANRAYAAAQREAGARGPVQMLAGPLHDANVYYGWVDADAPVEENFERVKHLAAYELRAYAVSSACLRQTRAALRAELAAPGETERESHNEATEPNS